jgi:hypothetical protein
MEHTHVSVDPEPFRLPRRVPDEARVRWLMANVSAASEYDYMVPAASKMMVASVLMLV